VHAIGVSSHATDAEARVQKNSAGSAGSTTLAQQGSTTSASLRTTSENRRPDSPVARRVDRDDFGGDACSASFALKPSLVPNVTSVFEVS
jgi:hypothetical protein